MAKLIEIYIASNFYLNIFGKKKKIAPMLTANGMADDT